MDGQRSLSSYDVVVVGSGIAGLYTALLAAPHCRVLLVTKGALEESNTRYAQGGIAAALGAGDSPALHLRDTLAAGDGLCDPQSVAVLTAGAPCCILDLINRGVAFDREGADLAVTLEGAHSLPRVLHAGGDATGASIERTLAGAVRDAGVLIMEGVFCTSLLTGEGRVRGVEIALPDGTSASAQASHVVLACGGAGQLFARTTNPAVATGDGLALAYRAGAQLMDLEFMQFHPTALALDGAPSFLISEAVRGEGGIVRDTRGYAFMADFHPDRELAPRDVVARAIHTQMERTDSSHVWLDVTHLPQDRVERRFPTIAGFCRRHGIDPLAEWIPVAPAAHYLMGGVRTDDWGRTSLPGLLACGEVACTGVHGANRLASNSLLEGLVFARRAVQRMLAGETGESANLPPGVRLAEPVAEAAPAELCREEIADLMWRHAGLVRSARSLSRAGQALESSPQTAWARSAVQSPADREAANLTLLARLLLRAASLREESRGAHFRSDFPRRDPAWQGHIVMSREAARLVPAAAAGRRHGPPAALEASHG